MDDLGDKLSGILNDPEAMERLKQVADNIFGDDEEESEKEPQIDIGSILENEQIGAIIKIISKMKSADSDPRTRLLTALKPNLSKKRQEKVDTAIKILKVIEILPIVNESGILKL